MSAKADGRMARWREQRWILDAVIRTVGVEWDQGRLRYGAAPGGAQAAAEFRTVGSKIKRVGDFVREFSNAAKKREAKALSFEESGRLVSARESYMTAALLWAAGRWPIFETNEELEHLENKMNHCFSKFIEYAPHPVEKVRIPFEGKELPGYLHLPRKPQPGETFPCVVNIPGMDSSKETGVNMYGDSYLERGIAVLSIDGPGQAESVALGIFVTNSNHMDAAKIVADWLDVHPAIDSGKLLVRGTSFGTYWGLQWAAALGDRIKGVAVSGVCHEPGCDTIFNMASPSFKLRYMWMADYENEAEFDKFAKTIDLRPFVPAITCPVLILAGEQDQLSPVEHSYNIFDLITAPKEIVVYEGANHSVADSSSVALGDNPKDYLADWLEARLLGQPLKSVKGFVDSSGRRTDAPA
ncbi:MAG: alpha/beta hydrolase [Pseudomonadota bacterium]|nr:alpha/beta hydrolase [Pseudomonadota bacterium]